jgi:peptidyl-prolyl cis-trans isomerase C
MVYAKGRNLLSWSVLLGAAAVSASAWAAASDASSVVASQGGANVTLADIDTFAERIPAERRAPFFDSPQRIETLISNLLVHKQLAALARSEGLDKDPAINAPGGLTPDERLAMAETKRFKEALVVPDLDELTREEYVAQPDKYSVPAALDVEQVLISTNSRSEAEAKALADKVEAEARKDPAQFEALVEKYSDDAGKSANHGLVRHAGNVPSQAFADAAKALAKPGDISPVINTEFGFHVLKLVAKAPAQRKTFDEVRPQILETLKKDYVERAVKNYTDTLRNKPIDANAELVASLRTRYTEKQPLPDPAAASAKKKAH